MYDAGAKRWISREEDEETLKWCREPFNKNNPEAMYLLADSLLSDLDEGDKVAEAVYLMEKAADLEYPDAAFAMGQMFEYGWGVGKNKKTARSWYEKAAALGHKEAAENLERLRKERVRSVLLACAGAAAALLAAAGIIFFLNRSAGVLVHRDTELTKTTSVEEFTRALGDLMKENDDEMVISGARKSNRLILKFEGDTIDLRDFPAAKVIANEDNMVVIQFETEEEAEACLQELKKRDGIIFVVEDAYTEFDLESSAQPVNSLPVSGALREEESLNTAGAEDKDDAGSTGTTQDTDDADGENKAGRTQDANDTGSSVSQEGGIKKVEDDSHIYPGDTESDYLYTSPYTGEKYYSWGVEAMGYDILAAWMKEIPTEPAVVAVLDTGCAPCAETEGRILDGLSPLTEGGKGQDYDPYFRKCYHGTHVAGTILDCTRGLDVSVLPVRIFLTNEETKAAASQGKMINCFAVTLSCIDYAISQDVDVINMSFGGDISYYPQDIQDAYDAMFEEAAAHGIVCVVSAGNDHGNTSDSWPAASDKCVVVGAIGEDQVIGDFSNQGENVDFCAPGVKIRSNVPQGSYADFYDLDKDGEIDEVHTYPNAYLADLNGTSMAAPHISALAAMLKMYHKDRTPAQIEQYMKDYCLDIGDQAHYGAGLPMPELFADAAGDSSDHADGAQTAGPPSEEEMKKIRDKAGAESGEITISLFWETEDDLDLRCKTPGGKEVYYNLPYTDGGTLDVDANKEGSIVEHPMENIYFEKPGIGQYQIYIVNYKDRTPSEQTKATLRVQVGDSVETKEYVLSVEGAQSEPYILDYNISSD